MRRTVISAVILVSLFWIQACDSGIDTGTDASEQLETLHLQLEEGSEFVLHLDPHLIQERRVFETLDDLHHFTDRIDDQGEVTLNKGLYLRFKHALSPSEIAALDMDGVSVVGNYRYEISEEAISKRDLTTPDAPLEVETYHGHSGKVYLEEFALIARHVGQWDKLNSSNFKDPEMRALFLQMKAGSQMKSKGKPTAPSAAPNTDQEFYGPVGTVYFNLRLLTVLRRAHHMRTRRGIIFGINRSAGGPRGLLPTLPSFSDRQAITSGTATPMATTVRFFLPHQRLREFSM